MNASGQAESAELPTEGSIQQTSEIRRHRVIAVIGIVVVSLIALGWVYWPRTDPRFVGRWIEREGEQSEAIWTFKQDGTLSLYTWSRRNGGEMVTLPYRWFIIRGRFYHTPVAPTAGQAISSTAGHLWNVMTNNARNPNVIIEELTPTSLVLRPVLPGPKHDAQLIRLRRLHRENEN